MSTTGKVFVGLILVGMLVWLYLATEVAVTVSGGNQVVKKDETTHAALQRLLKGDPAAKLPYGEVPQLLVQDKKILADPKASGAFPGWPRVDDHLRQQIVTAQEAHSQDVAILQGEVERLLSRDALAQDRLASTQRSIETFARDMAVARQTAEDRRKEIVELKRRLADQNRRLEEKEKTRVRLAADIDRHQKEFLARSAANLRLEQHLFDLQQQGAGPIGSTLRIPNHAIEGRVDRTDDTGTILRINLGRKHGVKPGDQLHVFRLKPAGRYLADVEILTASPESSVARVIDASRIGAVRSGDRVGSRILAGRSQPAGDRG